MQRGSSRGVQDVSSTAIISLIHSLSSSSLASRILISTVETISQPPLYLPLVVLHTYHLYHASLPSSPVSAMTSIQFGT